MIYLGWKERLQNWVMAQEDAAKGVDEAQRFLNALAGEDLSVHPLDSIALPLIHLWQQGLAFPRQFYQSIQEFRSKIHRLEAYDARMGVEHPVVLDGVSVLAGIFTRIPEMSALMIEAMPELLGEATQAAYSPGTFFPFLCRTVVEEPFLALSVVVADFVDGLLDPHTSAFSQGQRIVDGALYAFSLLDPGIKGAKALKGVFDHLPSSPPAALVAVDGSIGAGTIGRETVAAAGAGSPWGLGIGPLLRKGEDDEGRGKVIDFDPSRRKNGKEKPVGEFGDLRPLRGPEQRVAQLVEAIEDAFEKGEINRFHGLVQEIARIQDPAAYRALGYYAETLLSKEEIVVRIRDLVDETGDVGRANRSGYIRLSLGEHALRTLSAVHPPNAILLLKKLADGELVIGDWLEIGVDGSRTSLDFHLFSGSEPRAVEFIVDCLRQGQFGDQGIALLNDLLSRSHYKLPVQTVGITDVDWDLGRVVTRLVGRPVDRIPALLDYLAREGAGDLALTVIKNNYDDSGLPSRALHQMLDRVKEQPLDLSYSGVDRFVRWREQVRREHAQYPNLGPAQFDQIALVQTSHPELRKAAVRGIFETGTPTLHELVQNPSLKNPFLEVLSEEPTLLEQAFQKIEKIGDNELLLPLIQSGKSSLVELSFAKLSKVFERRPFKGNDYTLMRDVDQAIGVLRNLAGDPTIPAPIQERALTLLIEQFNSKIKPRISQALAKTGHPKAIEFFEERIKNTTESLWDKAKALALSEKTEKQRLSDFLTEARACAAKRQPS